MLIQDPSHPIPQNRSQTFSNIAEQQIEVAGLVMSTKLLFLRCFATCDRKQACLLPANNKKAWEVDFTRKRRDNYAWEDGETA